MVGEDGHVVESVLVADFGHASSRAFLVEKIAGAFRFVGHAEGPTSFGLPHRDLSIGWLRALRQLGHETGRCLVDHEHLRMPREPRGDGVDALMVCSSIGEPVRVAVIDTGVSATSAAVRRALRRSHARVMHQTAPSGRKVLDWVPAHGDALCAFQPEVVVLLLDGDRANAVPRALELLQRTRITVAPDNAVIYGPPKVLAQAKDLFGSRTKLRSVTPDDVKAEVLATELERATARRWAKRLDR
ncbi:MAG TPA: glutamate mutase L, partial [Thermomicrobiales bacterium]|nr:glutamate mutase L [Thermomicrobiales bacterium]